MNTSSKLVALAAIFLATSAAAATAPTIARCVSCGNVPTPGPIILPK